MYHPRPCIKKKTCYRHSHEFLPVFPPFLQDLWPFGCPKQEFGSPKTSARKLLANLQEAQHAKDFKAYGNNVRVVAMTLDGKAWSVNCFMVEVFGYPNVWPFSWGPSKE